MDVKEPKLEKKKFWDDMAHNAQRTHHEHRSSSSEAGDRTPASDEPLTPWPESGAEEHEDGRGRKKSGHSERKAGYPQHKPKSHPSIVPTPRLSVPVLAKKGSSSHHKSPSSSPRKRARADVADGGAGQTTDEESSPETDHPAPSPRRSASSPRKSNGRAEMK